MEDTTISKKETENIVENMQKLTETLMLELQGTKEGKRDLNISNMETIISDLQKTAQSLKVHVENNSSTGSDHQNSRLAKQQRVSTTPPPPPLPPPSPPPMEENRDVIEANTLYDYLRQYHKRPETSKRNAIHYDLYKCKDRFAFILQATKRCRADLGDGQNNMLFRSFDEIIFTLLIDEYLNFHKNNQMNDFLKETTKEDFGERVDPYVLALQDYVMLVCKPPPDWQPFNKASMKNINEIVRQVLQDIQNHGLSILPTEEFDIQQSIHLNKNRIHTHIKDSVGNLVFCSKALKIT
ncbi:hypothetical protein Q3G72_024819 [Acer saccharum]|nr:hypothetical protein Q3G72_024819 [Acer saccharum]